MTPLHSSSHAPFDIRWHGHWIWVQEGRHDGGAAFGGAPAPEPASHAVFRKSFTLHDVPSSAPARMTADSRYALYVNGHEASRGPIRSQPRRLHYDVVDLGPFLQQGENVIAVFVKYYGHPLSAWMPAAANSSLGRSGVFVFEAQLGDDWLVSDETWRACSGAGFSEPLGTMHANAIGGGVPSEIFDARALPHDWRVASFDDAAWEHARRITPAHIGGRGRSQPPSDPYGPLYPNPLPPLGGETLRPQSIMIEALPEPPEHHTDNPAERLVDSILTTPASAYASSSLPLYFEAGWARIVIDMGRIVAGLVRFELDAPAGTVLDFGYFEEPVRGRSMFGAHGGTRYIARGDHDAHVVFDPKGFRYACILVNGPLTLRDFAVREHVYQWQPGAGFACSDVELERIFAAGVRTVQLNSWDAFIDCPTREQRAWVGDAVVHQMVHLATNPDWRLALHYLSLSNSPRSDGILPMSVAGDVEFGGTSGIPDWSLHWLHGVHNAWRFTGDRARIKEYMPTMERVLRWYLPYLSDENVLQDVVEWNLVDWSALFTNDKSSILTALWARGLREFAEMAVWLGENASREWAESLYARARAGFEMFWDEARGTYVDHVRVDDGARHPAASQIAGAAAIVSGLAPRERWARIVETITDEGRLVARSWAHAKYGAEDARDMQARFGAMFMGVQNPDWDVTREIVRAEPFMSYLVHDAVAAAGMAERVSHLCRRWSEFLVDGYDTLGEDWGAGTHVHGWSSTPARDLVFYTLGVTPAEPGYAVAHIAPRPGSLTWMRGSVPTPHGLIHIEWRDGALTVDSPVPFDLDLPNRTVERCAAGRSNVYV